MAYVTGSASNIGDLLAALQTACTANGWTLTAGVLASGDCHLKATVSGSALALQAGLGDDGAGNLTTPSDVTKLQAILTGDPIGYPCTYFAHVSATEVYFVVRFAIDAYITMGFGQSPVPGLPGTGVWVHGNNMKAAQVSMVFSQSPAIHISSDSPACGLFAMWVSYYPGTYPCQVHHGLDGGAWSQAAFGGTGNPETGIDAGTNAVAGAFRLVSLASPNAWNSEAILAPVQPITSRGSGMVSMIADLANARYVRMDNIDAEAIVTLGTDKWRIYPFYRRNASNRNADSASNNSGTFGLALRYDGP